MTTNNKTSQSEDLRLTNVCLHHWFVQSWTFRKELATKRKQFVFNNVIHEWIFVFGSKALKNTRKRNWIESRHIKICMNGIKRVRNVYFENHNNRQIGNTSCSKKLLNLFFYALHLLMSCFLSPFNWIWFHAVSSRLLVWNIGSFMDRISEVFDFVRFSGNIKQHIY